MRRMKQSPGEVAAMIREVVDTQGAVNIPEERRCVFLFADGRRCRTRRCRAELCFHHDPGAAEKRKNRGRPLSRLRMLAATEVHAMLADTLRKLQAGQISPGEAYATGYLAQLVLGNLRKVREEFADAKNEWEHHVEVVMRVRRLDEGRSGKEAEEAEEAEESRGKAHRRGAEVAEEHGGDTAVTREDTVRTREVTRREGRE